MIDPKDREVPNGCGPWWLPKKLKDGYFIKECTTHDIDYKIGTDQKISDDKFYEAMKNRIRNDSQSNWLQKKMRFAQAWAYYHIVRKFGFISHKDGLDV